jgi:hypothetical protein
MFPTQYETPFQYHIIQMSNTERERESVCVCVKFKVLESRNKVTDFNWIVIIWFHHEPDFIYYRSSQTLKLWSIF